MRFSITLSLLLLLLFSKGICQNEFLSGLYFSSHEVVQDKRTSLNLTSSYPFKFPNGFVIEFETNFRRGDGYYGYVFRLIGGNQTNIDLVSNFAVRESNFSLIFKDQLLTSFNWKDIPDSGFGKWMKIRLEVDLKNSMLKIGMNGVVHEASIQSDAQLATFRLIFGAVRNSPFQSTDVCPMSLRDIRIFNSNGQLYRNWKLAKHAGNFVYDELKQAEAAVENPNWLIDRHVHWRKLKDIQVDSLMGFSADTAHGRLFLVDKNLVYTLDLSTLKTDTFRSISGTPYMMGMGMQVIYNPYENQLWSYNFDNPNISRLNISDKIWSESPGFVKELGFAHHNKLISPVDSSLITMMGYGFYTYKNTVHHYDEKRVSWDRIDTENEIEPRYLASAGLLNEDKLLIFGGYGSKTGKQEVAPEYYYDLYSFDLKDKQFSKLLDYPVPQAPYLPGEKLVVDRASNSFYVLVFNNSKFNTNLRLAKFGIQEPTQQFYDDSIPFNYLDTESWTDLFLNKGTNELIAMTAHNSQISLFSIAYPPLMIQDVNQNVSRSKYKLSRILGFILLSIMTIALGVFVVKRRKNKIIPHTHTGSEDQGDISVLPGINRTQVSSVLFLGGFQIFDKNGIDITSGFSPTIKQLFLIIFLNTIRNGKGISSLKLDDALWSDKDERSARNNRNVNVSKLRSALEDVGGLEVINENSFWKIDISPAIYCDYSEVVELIRKSQISELEEDEIARLAGLLSFGELLPNVQTSWGDPFKSALANDVIDCLIKLIRSNRISSDYSLKYHLADLVFIFDPVNEDALAAKCLALSQIGKRSIAKNAYTSFCRDYKQLLGTEYQVSFNEIIG